MRKGFLDIWRKQNIFRLKSGNSDRRNISKSYPKNISIDWNASKFSEGIQCWACNMLNHKSVNQIENASANEIQNFPGRSVHKIVFNKCFRIFEVKFDLKLINSRNKIIQIFFYIQQFIFHDFICLKFSLKRKHHASNYFPCSFAIKESFATLMRSN